MAPEEVQVDFNDDTRVLTIRGEHTETSESKEQPGKGTKRGGHWHR